jgi:hypothetical protein
MSTEFIMPDPLKLLLAKNDYSKQQAIAFLLDGCPEKGEVSKETLVKMVGKAFDLGVIAEGSSKN